MRNILATILLVGLSAAPAFAQGAPLPEAPLPAPPQGATNLPPQELERIVSPIALYPDPLLGQILTAATFSPEIPAAARWSDQHHYLAPGQLPAAIAEDGLPYQPSVQALLPFPQVLGMMASDMPWTEELGGAFLNNPGQVMDAVQRMRHRAYDFGYLRSNAQVVVRSGPYIEIAPVDPGFIVVPYYNPGVVFIAPRPGFAVATAVSFGFGVRIGAAFAPWGWGATRFAWGDRVLFVNNTPWRRTWTNRTVYVHPFAAVPRRAVARPAEQHELHERSEVERESERTGRSHDEEHRR